MTLLMTPQLKLALLLAALTALPAPALADRGRDRWRDITPHSYAPSTAAQGRIGMDEAIAKVQRLTGGRVLDAREKDGGYRLKVLTRNGEVRVIFVDPATGEMR
ncbi:MAG: PepSY domain-containing protein [Burkholderiales bacterium]